MAAAANFDSSSSSDASGEDRGFSFEFVEEKNTEKLSCIICHMVIRDFSEVGCGHGSCKYCIETWEDKKYR